MVGFVGTALHVAAWLCAVIFDMILFSQINYEKTPGAFTFCLWGFVSLVIGFVALVGVTLMHAFSSENTKIPEGGAPPFLMTMFIGGAQISLILTILQLIAMLTVPKDADSAYVWIDMSALADGETRDDKINALRNLNVWTMISKVYIVQFLKNNQEWAGPANELKKQAAIGIGPRRKDGTFAQARM
jgi:hypothetical protein